MGSFTLGFNGKDKKGGNTRWCQNPYVFDNTYYKELLMGEHSVFEQQEADIKLVQTPELRQWVEVYAQDQDLFFQNYAKAHVKVSEQTHEETLMCEFDEKNIVPGWGYMEVPQHRAWLGILRDLINRKDGTEEWVQ